MLVEVRRDGSRDAVETRSSPRSLHGAGCEQALAVGTNPELLEARGAGPLDLC